MPNLLDALSDSENTIDLQDENLITPIHEFLEINPEKRLITIPESEQLFGVYGENKVEIKYFKCPRIILNDIDLYECYIFVNYISASGKIGYIQADTVVLDETENYIIFTWELTRNVFDENIDTDIYFSISAKQYLEDKEPVFFTRKAKGNLYETVYAEEQITEQYADIILQLLAEMDGVKEIATPEAMQAYVDNWLKENLSVIGGNASDISYDDTETKLGATNVQDAIGKLSDTINNQSGSETGITAEVKAALMAVVENIGLWKDGNGQSYIDNLRTALYNAPLSSISVVYNQSKTVYPTDALDVLRSDLVVTGTYTDGSSAIVTDYTLIGSLLAGTSTITVAKDGKTATFEVTVAEARVPATGITLNNTTLSFTGSTPIQLTATVEPSNSTDTVVWSSSEDAVATVEDGLITPISDGSCTIYATAGDFTAECAVSVTKPLNGINIGNPYLTLVNGMPSSVATTEEEAQGKWYKALFTAWTKTLNIEKTFFLHPLTNGTFYIRMVGRTLSDPIEFYAFQNADIGLNPTATLGKVGTDYTDATVTKLTGFDWVDYAGNEKSSTVDLGEWTYVDNSGTTYGVAFVALYKVVIPEDIYVFMATSEMGANKFPGISENYPYMNDLYTIFGSDPSANILQIVE